MHIMHTPQKHLNTTWVMIEAYISPCNVEVGGGPGTKTGLHFADPRILRVQTGGTRNATANSFRTRML